MTRLERHPTALERLRTHGKEALPLIKEENDVWMRYRDAFERSRSEENLLKRLEYKEMLPALHAEMLEIKAKFYERNV